jgi:hypothetical protein
MSSGIPAVVTMVLAASLALAGCSGDSDREPSAGPSASRTTTPAPSAPALPPAPDGTRWQGANGVVVAVPAGWDTVTEVCAHPEGEAVRYLSRAQLTARCAVRGRHRDSTLVVAADRVTAAMIAGRLPVRSRIGGLDVRSSRARCPDPAPAGCTLTFAVPAAGVTFQLRYRGTDARAFAGALRGSLTALPAGLVTVPAVRYGVSDAAAIRQLTAAGLVAAAPDVDFPHYVTGTLPPAGSAVQEGASVELQVGDG